MPKAIIEQLQITDKLDLEVENQRIILRPLAQRPRQGWREAFTHMHDEQQDKLLLEDTNENEAFEWEW